MVHRLTLIFLLVTATFFLNSCDKSETQSPPSILGEWKTVERTIQTDSSQIDVRINDILKFAINTAYVITLNFEGFDTNQQQTIVYTKTALINKPEVHINENNFQYKINKDSMYFIKNEIDTIRRYHIVLTNTMLLTTRKIDAFELRAMLEQEQFIDVNEIPSNTHGIIKTREIRVNTKK